MLGDTAQQPLDRYAGDLRKLRAAAGRRPDQERTLLNQFKGIGEVGADTSLREIQLVWDEVRPFWDADTRQGPTGHPARRCGTSAAICSRRCRSGRSGHALGPPRFA